MGLALSNYSGDGKTVPLVDVDIQLPDAGVTVTLGGSVMVQGATAAIPGTLFAIAPATTVTAPAPPGSGSTYWIIQMNTTTGVVSVKSGAGAQVVDAGNIILYSAVVPAGQQSLSQDAGVTPDSW